MAQTAIDLLNRGQKANESDAYRTAGLITLPDTGELVIAGDLHGHRRNFDRICTYADLENHPKRHVVLQEIIHGGPEDTDGGCLSYKLLLDAIRYKLQFPNQVHIIMGNHDTACINNSDVMKNGREMNRAMAQAIENCYGDRAEDVILALRQYLFSQPLAVRTANRIWASHSLPADRFIEKFDPGIFQRELRINDVVRPGSAYLLTWGRRHSQNILDRLAEILDVDIFVLGHQPQTEGWKQAGDNLLILASEHNHGTILHVDLAETYTIDSLIERTVPLTSIV